MMKEKKIVPIWVSAILAILLIAGIGLNIYYTITTYNAIEEIPTRLFDFLACFYALTYCFKGYSKNVASTYKIFSITYCISCMLPIFLVAKTYQAGIASAIVLALHLIVFACTSIFAFAKDLGKKKSYTLAAIVLACTLINSGFGIAASTPFILGMCGKVILSIVFLIMVYAKYQDKTARGTK